MVIFMCNMFSKRLRELRLSHNLKQSDMANLLNVSIRTYQRYESSDNETDFKTLILLADYFKVSIDYLLGRTDNPDLNK